MDDDYCEECEELTHLGSCEYPYWPEDDDGSPEALNYRRAVCTCPGGGNDGGGPCPVHASVDKADYAE